MHGCNPESTTNGNDVAQAAGFMFKGHVQNNSFFFPDSDSQKEPHKAIGREPPFKPVIFLFQKDTRTQHQDRKRLENELSTDEARTDPVDAHLSQCAGGEAFHGSVRPLEKSSQGLAAHTHSM